MSCRCHEEEMAWLEERFDREAQRYEARIRRLRQALLDAGLPLSTVNAIDNGG